MTGRAAEAWKEIAALRFSSVERSVLRRIDHGARLLKNNGRTVERIDYGVGSGGGASSVTVGRLARNASVSPSWGTLLFKLVRTHRPLNVLELGTCLGISASYLQGALDLNGAGLLTTIEGDPALCRLAEDTISRVSTRPFSVVNGRFTDVLADVSNTSGPFDFVFIDGHHNPDAVEAYYNMLVPFLTESTMVVIDDIQPVTGAVRPAWNRLRQRPETAWFVNLIRIGILGRTTAQ